MSKIQSNETNLRTLEFKFPEQTPNVKAPDKNNNSPQTLEYNITPTNPSEELAIKKGLDTNNIKGSLVRPLSSSPVLTANNTQSAEAIDIRSTLQNQINFEGTNHYDQNTRNRISQLSPASSVPEGSYNSVATKQFLNVPKVKDPNLLNIVPLTSKERGTLANINKLIAVKEKEIIKATNSYNPDNPSDTSLLRISTLKNEISSLNGRREWLWNRDRLSASAPFNGRVFQATASNADPNKPPVIFVNGVNTDIGRSGTEALELSRLFKSPVNHVVNVNDIDKAKAISGAALSKFSNLTDSERTTKNLSKGILSNPRASTAAANQILSQLEDKNYKGPVKVVGYSQGGVIIADALRHVKGVYDQRVKSGKLKLEEANKQLERVRVLGLGAAAAHRDLPPVFRKNYRLIYDKNDPVVQARGVTSEPNVGKLSGLQGESSKPGFIVPHLSYFKHYEQTDPGSVSNEATQVEAQRWFSGAKGHTRGAIEFDLKNQNYSKEITPI